MSRCFTPSIVLILYWFFLGLNHVSDRVFNLIWAKRLGLPPFPYAQYFIFCPSYFGPFNTVWRRSKSSNASSLQVPSGMHAFLHSMSLKCSHEMTTWGFSLFFLNTTIGTKGGDWTGQFALACPIADQMFNFSWFFASKLKGMSFLAAEESCTSSPFAPIDVERMSSLVSEGYMSCKSVAIICWSFLPFALQDCVFISSRPRTQARKQSNRSRRPKEKQSTGHGNYDAKLFFLLGGGEGGGGGGAQGILLFFFFLVS